MSRSTENRSWIAGAAALWSLVYGGLAVSWALGWRTYPFGIGDPGAEDASVLAGVLLLGGGLVWWRPRGWPFVAFGWTVTAGLLLLIDLRLFNVVGYLAAAPVLVAVVRYVWALGVPWGISPEFHAQNWPWLWVLGAGLATAALGGAVLTIGLIRPWGEVFPRWVPWLRGRPVPPAFPSGPAVWWPSS